MDKQDGSKRIPIGTFGSSDPPLPAQRDEEAASTPDREPVEPVVSNAATPSGASTGADSGEEHVSEEPPTVPGGRGPRYPATLSGRPSHDPDGSSEPESMEDEAAEDEPRRPSVRSFPPPKAIGTPVDAEAPADHHDAALGDDADPFGAPLASVALQRGAATPPTEAGAMIEPPGREPLEDARDQSGPAPDEPRALGTSMAAGVGETVRRSRGPALAPSASAGARFVVDANVKWGIAVLATMFAIGFGGWYLTGGSYRDRRVLTPPPAAVPSAAQPGLPQPNQPAAVNPPVPEPAANAGSKNGKTTIPDVPTVDDLRNALAPLLASLTECAKGRTGTAQLDFTFVAKGRVVQLIVGGDFRGKPEAVCIARIARSIEVPRFKKPRARIVYPLPL